MRIRPKRLTAPLLSLACLLSIVPAVPAQAPNTERSEALQRLEDSGLREIIVARAPRLTASDRSRVRSRAGASHVRNLRLRDTEIVRVAAGRLVETLGRLNADPDVRFAEVNGRVQAQSTDPLWTALWGLDNTGQSVLGAVGTADADIDAPEAWSRSTGAGQTVAVVDTGVHFGHEDLQGQFVISPGESGSGRETNRVDDDRNGLIDDYRGWDFVGDDNDPTDGNGHGTHVAGTIAARKDNALGVAGVAPDSKLLTLRVLDAGGAGSTADVAEAFDLAGDLGVKTVNASLGGVSGAATMQAVAEAVANHPQTLYVVAAGNAGDDNEQMPFYPCNLPQANLICVGATDSGDARAGFSNYGRASVDLYAPGVKIASTYIDAPAACPTQCYAGLDGTSMASPHVAATVALMRAADPGLDAAQLKAKLLAAADTKAGLVGTSVTGGRLNANAAVLASLDTDGDGVVDTIDNCPTAANAGQVDADRDAAGDVCDATPRGDDADGDGVGALDDNCPATANANQSDRDGDTLGDVCDPTPDGPVSVAPIVGLSAPVLAKLTMSRTTLTRTKPAVLKFTLDRAATVTLTVERKSGARYKRVKTVTLNGAAGANRYKLRRRIGQTTLRPGRYRLTVSARAGRLAAASKLRLRFAVR